MRAGTNSRIGQRARKWRQWGGLELAPTAPGIGAAPRFHYHYIDAGGTKPDHPARAIWVLRTMSDAAPIKHPTELTGGDFTEADEPLRLFAAWFADAKQSEPVNPEAMTLATVDAQGLPNARMVTVTIQRIQLLWNGKTELPTTSNYTGRLCSARFVFWSRGFSSRGLWAPTGA